MSKLLIKGLSQILALNRHRDMEKKNNQKQKVVILGGGYAGVNSALRLRLRNKNVEITLINNRDRFVERIRNHEHALGIQKQKILLREVLGESINFQVGYAEKIDPISKSVLIRTESGQILIPYGILVYALGSGEVRENKNLHSINSREGAEKLRMELLQKEDFGIVVVGAGVTGIELATELREKFPERNITLVGKNPLGSHLNLSSKAKEYLHQVLSEMKIGFETRNLDLFNDLDFLVEMNRSKNLVVDCTGFLSPTLAKESGLICDEKNRVVVNESLQAEGHSDIFVAGDSASYKFGIESIQYSGCATAMPMGTFAGECIAKILQGADLEHFNCGFIFRCISLGRKKGVIQFLNKDSGQPNDKILTGRVAAIFKENVCRLTVVLPMLEKKTGLPIFSWRKTQIMKRIDKLTELAV